MIARVTFLLCLALASIPQGRADSLPDLHGIVFGLEKASPGSACWDPAQPWFISFDISNPGGVKLKSLDLKLHIMNGPKLVSGVFASSEQLAVDALAEGSTGVNISVRLPKNVPVGEVGTKRAFRLVIDPPYATGGVIKESDEMNNLVDYELGVAPPVQDGLTFQEQPDQMLKITSTAGISGDKKHIQVQIKNFGPVHSKPLRLFLVVALAPQPGFPTGSTADGYSVEIPSLAPGAQTWVTIGSDYEFVEPDPAVTIGSKTPLSSPIAISRKAGFENIRVTTTRTRTFFFPKTIRLINITAPKPLGYTVLRNFKLRILGTQEVIYIGVKRKSREAGPIRIPGKH